MTDATQNSPGGPEAPESNPPGECDLCGLPTPDPPVTAPDAEGSYCCDGCLQVARTLDEVPGAAVDDLDTGPSTESVDGDAVYLDVDGMHCATCEAFLESRATGIQGVAAANASYATGMMKVVYDAESTTGDAIADGLGGYGYRVSPAGSEADDEYETIGRLLVGGFFGMMAMVWYVLFLYPAYLGVPTESLLFDVTGPAGRYLLWNVWLSATIVLGYTGYPILRGAFVSLRAGRPNMDLLVALAASAAYVYSIGVLFVGGHDVYFDISVVVVLAVTLGGYYEDRIRRRATDGLAAITEDRITQARIRTVDGTETVAIEDLEAGDELVVRPGERIPVDGTIIDGNAACDESLVTGESLPVERGPGDTAVGGARVTDGALVIRVGANASSTMDRLVSVLWELQTARGGVQRLADRIAAVFVPLVLVLAVGAFGWHLLSGATPSRAFLTAMAVLVVSCPCALGLATPLAIASGVRESLDRGIIVTDASAFERAPSVDVVALDKTGTLTTGRLQVVEVATTGDVAESAVLSRAAAVEQFADHPIAAAIVEAASGTADGVADFEQVPGRGVAASVAGERVVVGSRALLEDRGIEIPGALEAAVEDAHSRGHVPAVVGWGGRARGVVVAGDEPRPEWETVVTDLATDRRVVVISGDSDAATERFRAHPAVDEAFAGVPPEAKAEVVERLRADGTVAMVGDGSNDAPALAAADVGVALQSGARLAVDAADLVVTTDDLSTVPAAFTLLGATRTRVRENLGWAFCYNAIAIPVALAGLLNPLFAALAMATSSLLVVGNSTRSLAASATGDERSIRSSTDRSPVGTDPEPAS